MTLAFFLALWLAGGLFIIFNVIAGTASPMHQDEHILVVQQMDHSSTDRMNQVRGVNQELVPVRDNGDLNDGHESTENNDDRDSTADRMNQVRGVNQELVPVGDNGDLNDGHESTENNDDRDSTEQVAHVGTPEVHSYIPLKLLQNIYLPTSYNDRDLNAPEHTIAYRRDQTFPAVRSLKSLEKKRILVTGGAGFVGSHLVDRLMLMGHEVIVLDNFFTGSKRNIRHWMGHPNFELIRHDVVDPYMIEVDQIYHLACPASPPHYQYNPIKTVKTNVMGTINMLGLAKRTKARFLLTSTSEVYGDPEEHPQRETYWGHVNPIGPRACYDEGKRVAETLTYSYMHQDDVDVRVARIFNTFGPRMNQEDGRVVSNFIMQALRGENLTIYGDGSQTRSFQYIHDLVDALILLMERNFSEPVNIGNPEEFTIKDFACFIRDQVNPSAEIQIMPATMDDPRKRRPDITRAKTYLDWRPRFSVKQGIQETVAYFRRQLAET